MSIFDEKNKVKGNWFTFAKVGDKIEGTLISKRTVVNQLSGKDQIIYEIMMANREVWNVGGKVGIDMQMRNVQLGQIVGFEFVEVKPSKMVGRNPTKIIQVFANKTIRNEEWIKEQAEQASAELAETGKMPETFETPGPARTNDEMFGEISLLAGEKLGAKTPAEVPALVMKATGIAFIEENYPQLVDALRQMPNNS